MQLGLGLFLSHSQMIGASVPNADALADGEWTLTAAQTRPDGGALLASIPAKRPTGVRWSAVADPGQGDIVLATFSPSGWVLGQFPAGEHTVWISYREAGQAWSPFSLTSKTAELFSYAITPDAATFSRTMIAGEPLAINVRDMFDFDPLWSAYPVQFWPIAGALPPWSFNGDWLTLFPPSDWPPGETTATIWAGWPDATFVTAPPSNATAPTIVAVGGTVSVTNLGTCDGAPQPWVEGVRWEVDGEPISETSFRLTDRVEGEEIQMFQTWRGIAGGSVEVGSNIVTVGAASDHVTFDSTVVTFDSTLRTFDEAA